MNLFAKEWRELRDLRWVGAGAALVFWGLVVAMANSMKPEDVQAALLWRMDSLLNFFLVLLFFPVAATATLFNGEVDRGTIDFERTLPVSRLRVFGTKALALLGFNVLLLLAWVLIGLPVLHQLGTEEALGNFLGMLPLLLMCLCAGTMAALFAVQLLDGFYLALSMALFLAFGWILSILVSQPGYQNLDVVNSSEVWSWGVIGILIFSFPLLGLAAILDRWGVLGRSRGFRILLLIVFWVVILRFRLQQLWLMLQYQLGLY